MNIPSQTTIDQYLADKNVPREKKEKVVLAITDIVYDRNQNVIHAETAKDEDKLKQFLRSVEEYDDMIDKKIDAILNDQEAGQNFDF